MTFPFRFTKTRERPALGSVTGLIVGFSRVAFVRGFLHITSSISTRLSASKGIGSLLIEFSRIRHGQKPCAS